MRRLSGAASEIAEDDIDDVLSALAQLLFGEQVALEDGRERVAVGQVEKSERCDGDVELHGIDIAAEPLVIASEQLGLVRRLLKRFVTVPVLVVAVVAAVASDYYLYPPRELPCGHAKKDVFLFGAFRTRHGCPAMRALYYLDRARGAIGEELDRGADVPPIFLSIMALQGVGRPPADVPYSFNIEKDLSLTADPDDAASGLPSLCLELDGVIRVETAESGLEAGPGSPVAGRFDGDGWVVTPRKEKAPVENAPAKGGEGPAAPM